MTKIFQFGEKVEGYNIPVLNEREVRAGAGLLFFMMFVAIMTASLKENFTMIKYAAIIFLCDMLIRVLVSPRFSPFLILGRWIVSNQTPEYVGAPQKKFAWIIGIILAVIMVIHLIIINGYSPITGIICMICLIFLFFESSFGICLGCLFYPLFFKEKLQLCPGDVCDPKVKQPIQKTSFSQWLVVIIFLVGMIVFGVLANPYLSKAPTDIFGLTKHFEKK